MRGAALEPTPMGQDGAVPTVILRSLLGRVGTVLVTLAGLWVTAVVWLADGYGHGLQVLAASATVVLVVWLLWWRPQARLDLDAVTVRNAWRTHTVGWDALRSVQTRWGLVLEVADGAAPSSAVGSPTAGEGTTPARRVPVSACPRGGLFTAMRHERRVPQAHDRLVEMRLEETAPTRTEKARLDCDDAGYLLDIYKANRAEYLSVSRRLRHRSERLARRGGAVPVETAGSPDGASAQPSAEAGSGTEPRHAVGLVSRWDAAPLAAAAACAVGLLLTTTLL